MISDLTFQTTNELWQECVVDSSIKTVYKVSVERSTYTLSLCKNNDAALKGGGGFKCLKEEVGYEPN